MSEELIGLGAYTLFATHFTALSELAELYPNAKLWHFSVEGSAQVTCSCSSREGTYLGRAPTDTLT